MNKADVKRAKAKILKCLTEDVQHGRKKSLAIFDEKSGHQVYNDTDLKMIMDKVVLGLYLALADSDQPQSEG
jgi:hypothetical protein